MRHTHTMNENILLIKKSSLEKLLFIYIPVVLLFFQYQISWIYAESDPTIQITYYCIIFIFTLAFVLQKANSKFVWKLLLIGLMIGSIVIDNPVHIAMSAWFLIYGYCLVMVSNESFNKILKFLFLLNAVVMICQLLGVNSIFYAYQNYSNNTTNFISFLDNETTGYVRAHQARMSGIFPSTISLSVFQFLIFGQLVASKAYGSKFGHFFVGLIFSMAGSTVSVMLFISSIIFVFQKYRLVYFQVGFLLGVFILFYFFNSIFEFNYTLETKLSRIDSRFFSDAGNSLFTSNFLGVVIIVCSMLAWVMRKFLKQLWDGENIFKLLLFLLMIVSPLLIHPLQDDIHYWLNVGVSLAQYMVSYIGSKNFSKVAAINRKQVSYS